VDRAVVNLEAALFEQAFDVTAAQRAQAPREGPVSEPSLEMASPEIVPGATFQLLCKGRQIISWLSMSESSLTSDAQRRLNPKLFDRPDANTATSRDRTGRRRCVTRWNGESGGVKEPDCAICERSAEYGRYGCRNGREYRFCRRIGFRGQLRFSQLMECKRKSDEHRRQCDARLFSPWSCGKQPAGLATLVVSSPGGGLPLRRHSMQTPIVPARER